MKTPAVKEYINAMNSKMLIGIAIVAVAALAGIGYRVMGGRGGTAELPGQAEPVAVPVITVAPRTVDSVVAATGALASKNSSMLSQEVQEVLWSGHDPSLKGPTARALGELANEATGFLNDSFPIRPAICTISFIVQNAQ